MGPLPMALGGSNLTGLQSTGLYSKGFYALRG